MIEFKQGRMSKPLRRHHSACWSHVTTHTTSRTCCFWQWKKRKNSRLCGIQQIHVLRKLYYHNTTADFISTYYHNYYYITYLTYSTMLDIKLIKMIRKFTLHLIHKKY